MVAVASTCAVTVHALSMLPDEACHRHDQDGTLLSLEELMYRYPTDKSKDDHKYSDLYAMLFDPIRCRVRDVLEAGIGGGESMRVWHEYFLGATIHGVDSSSFPGYRDDMKNRVASFGRVQLYWRNTQDPSAMAKLNFTRASMDVVIDDAAHDLHGQERTLQVLWPLVRPGGYYVIEDAAWDRDLNTHPFLHPQQIKRRTLRILQENDAVYADTMLGHRAWSLWQERFRAVRPKDRVPDYFGHNSHLVVIRKRTRPLRQVLVNFGNPDMAR